MNFLECLRIALKSIRVNKMRSILTMLGIIIGISSVITVVSIGRSGENTINAEFEIFGVNRFYLFADQNKKLNQSDYLTMSDLEAINRNYGDDIRGLSPSIEQRADVTNKIQLKDKDSLFVNLSGVNETYLNIEMIEVIEGRFLSEEDYDMRKSVGVIDEKLALELFGKTDVVGERLDVNMYGQASSFRIIGVYKKPNSAMSFAMDSTTTFYIPYNVLSSKMGLSDTIYYFQGNIQDGVDFEAFKTNIKNLLSKRHNNSPEKYDFFNAKEQMDSVNQVMGIITGIIGAIAAISLLVGGIGVMNIMLVSVTERTREIGIRKALGAKRKDILLQFLVESVIISFIGGVIGTIIGIIVAIIISTFLKMPPTVPVSAVLVAWGFSAAVGIFFGIYPANKAAKLDPIDALRYE